ncbi:MAG: glycine oxidase ThiO [Solirubrobacteraceae bacterium]
MSQRADALIVGGGVIGLAVGWRAARSGMRVTIVERGAPGAGTSRVAAGMIAPISEAEPAQRPLLELTQYSAAAFPRFVEELQAQAGRDAGYLRCGTLMVARDADEAAVLRREHAMRTELGLPVRALTPSEARALEPALAPTMRGALEFDGDRAIDPLALTAALSTAFANAGGELIAAEVAAIEHADGAITGVEVKAGRVIDATQVVIAAGPWSPAIEGLPEHARVPLRPVKGQILSLRDPAGPGLFTRVLRMQPGYLVPRGDGRYALGASVEERGFDTAVTAGPVFELLRDAIELVPGLSELQIEELSAGIRPTTPDNMPAIGPGSLDGLYWATGHYRHGILLAPATAELVLAALCGEPPPIPGAAAFAPGRFRARQTVKA